MFLIKDIPQFRFHRRVGSPKKQGELPLERADIWVVGLGIDFKFRVLFLTMGKYNNFLDFLITDQPGLRPAQIYVREQDGFAGDGAN